jgi:hypothetical protein
VDRPVPIRPILLLAAIAAAVGLAFIVTSAANRPTTSEATGVVVAVEGQGLGDVKGFTLRLAGGELMEFSLRALENGTAFPPGHLAEHQATAAPVRVFFRTDGDERLAIRLEDAPR